MRIPTSASASGIPTAHPMMRPRLEPPPEEEVLEPGSAPAAAVGVLTIVISLVTTPAGPDETLLEIEVTGVGVAEARDVCAAFAEDARSGARLDEDGAGVREGEPPLAEPDARPVKPETVGWDEAWFWPIVAYALPS